MRKSVSKIDRGNLEWRNTAEDRGNQYTTQPYRSIRSADVLVAVGVIIKLTIAEH